MDVGFSDFEGNPLSGPQQAHPDGSTSPARSYPTSPWSTSAPAQWARYNRRESLTSFSIQEDPNLTALPSPANCVRENAPARVPPLLQIDTSPPRDHVTGPRLQHRTQALQRSRTPTAHVSGDSDPRLAQFSSTNSNVAVAVGLNLRELETNARLAHSSTPTSFSKSHTDQLDQTHSDSTGKHTFDAVIQAIADLMIDDGVDIDENATVEMWAMKSQIKIGASIANIIASNALQFTQLCRNRKRSAAPNFDNFRTQTVRRGDSNMSAFSLDSNRKPSHGVLSNGPDSHRRKKSVFLVNQIEEERDSDTTTHTNSSLRKSKLQNRSRKSIAFGLMASRRSRLVSALPPEFSSQHPRSSKPQFGDGRNYSFSLQSKHDDSSIHSPTTAKPRPIEDSDGEDAEVAVQQPTIEEATAPLLPWSERRAFNTPAQSTHDALLARLERAKSWYLLLIFVIHVFNFIVVPIRIAVGSHQFPPAFMWCELALDVATMLLAPARMLLPVEDRGRVIIDSAAVRADYRRSRLMLDVAALFPLQLVLYPLVAADAVGPVATDFARVNRMLYAVSFSALFDDVAERWLAALHPLVHRLAKFLLVFLCYVFATAAPVMMVFRADLEAGRDWMQLIHVKSDAVDYAIVFMQTLGITSGRNFPLPITDSQTIVMTFICFLGMGSMSVIINGVTSLIVSLVERSSKLVNKLEDAAAQLEHVGMSPQITAEILDYYSLMFRMYNTFDFEASEDTFDELPFDLRQYIEDHVHLGIIRRITLFEHVTDPNMIRAIARGLEMYVVMPGTVIAVEGEEGFDMYFIAKGVATASCQRFPELSGELTEGDFFGQTCLVFSDVQHMTVVAKTVTQLFALSKENFDALALTFPKLITHVREAAAPLHERIITKKPTNNPFLSLANGRPASALKGSSSKSSSSCASPQHDHVCLPLEERHDED